MNTDELLDLFKEWPMPPISALLADDIHAALLEAKRLRAENERLRAALIDLMAIEDWHRQSYSCRFCHHQARTPECIVHSLDCVGRKVLEGGE